MKAKAPSSSPTTAGDAKKPAPASPAKAAGAAALKRAALIASTDGSVPASLFDDLDLPASPARVTVPAAAAEPPAAQKPAAPTAGATEKPKDGAKDEKKPDTKKKEDKENKKPAAVPEPPEVPIVWQVTFAKARYFERVSNTVPKHDVPPPSPQNGTSTLCCFSYFQFLPSCVFSRANGTIASGEFLTSHIVIRIVREIIACKRLANIAFLCSDKGTRCSGRLLCPAGRDLHP